MFKTIILSIIILFSSSSAWAQRTEGCTKPLNERYSFKDFMNINLRNVPAAELNNTCIKGSNFYQEWQEGDVWLEKEIFPSGIRGVEFVRCNLDNVHVPDNNVVSPDSSKRIIRVQNDLEDWKIDKVTEEPTEPIEKERFEREGKSTDPEDIPDEKITPDVISITP